MAFLAQVQGWAKFMRSMISMYMTTYNGEIFIG